MVSEHSGRGVSISLLFVHKIYSLSFYIFDHLGFACCFSLDLISIIDRIDRSIVSWFNIDRSEDSDQVLNKTFHFLVDYVTRLLDPKVPCVRVIRSVTRTVDQVLFNLKSSPVESRILF